MDASKKMEIKGMEVNDKVLAVEKLIDLYRKGTIEGLVLKFERNNDRTFYQASFHASPDVALRGLGLQ